MVKAKPKPSEPVFTRGEVAEILNCSPLTISNREKAGKYPLPKRDLNNYRIYSLGDVLALQQLTYASVDTRVIMSKLYDKGYRDMKLLGKMIDAAINHRSGAYNGGSRG